VLSDYLGSPRVVMDHAGLVQERNSYYPSGLRIDALSSTPTGSPDVQDGWAGGRRAPAATDFYGQLHGRRFYDPAVMSWYAVEPLATQYASYSGYSYSLGDPVNLRDATGMEPDGLSYNAHEINSMTYSERRQLGLVWSFTGRGYVAPGVDWTSPFGPAGYYETVVRERAHVIQIPYTYFEGLKPIKRTGYYDFTIYEEYLDTRFVYDRAYGPQGLPSGAIAIGGSNAPQYSGPGPLSTATAMGPPDDYVFGIPPDQYGVVTRPITYLFENFWGPGNAVNALTGFFRGQTIGGKPQSKLETGLNALGAVGSVIYIKGWGNVARELFHSSTKGLILKAARATLGNSAVLRAVGKNPDIAVEAGEIILKGTGPFDGKILKTGLDPTKFF
jgi:RHS repeat-associated protein